ncbi:hypothetical protein HOLleu_23863 [Holothuria leucospilota]|uniref:Replication protein A OB domain-containing protein n=1 Tax=Holothuria leucospilota TaxID=206669 RepID=A0A9Q1BVE8_HOLLE|nr:hypothetical protein HOLleu_23863 [Holothuria leucospilota]
MFTIAELKNKKPSPYTKPVKCKVLAVSEAKPFTTNGQDKQLYHVALSDNTALLKATVYDKEKMNLIKVGSTLIINNYVFKSDKSMTLTSVSKIYKTANITIDPTYQTAADDLIHPKPPPVQNLKSVKTSPKKILTSVSGKIIKDEEPKRVMVKSQPSFVRNIFLQDHTEAIEVALWRRAAESPAKLGDWVEISHVVVNESNTFHQEPFVASTQNTQITVKPMPACEMKLIIIGYTISEETFILLCTTDHDTMQYTATEQSVNKVLSLPSSSIISDTIAVLDEKIPFSATAMVKDDEILFFKEDTKTDSTS